jgi:hypothetical protein
VSVLEQSDDRLTTLLASSILQRFASRLKYLHVPRLRASAKVHYSCAYPACIGALTEQSHRPNSLPLAAANHFSLRLMLQTHLYKGKWTRRKRTFFSVCPHASSPQAQQKQAAGRGADARRDESAIFPVVRPSHPFPPPTTVLRSTSGHQLGSASSRL